MPGPIGGALAQITNGQLSDASQLDQFWTLFNGGIVHDVVGTYGARGDGVTDDTAAINAALAAAQVVGGTVYFRAGGTYLCSGQLSVSNLVNVRLVGGGAGPSSSTGAWLLYTGGGTGNFLDFTGGNGVRLQNLGISYSSSSFTGTLVKFSVTNGTIRECALRGVGGTAAATYLLSLDAATEVHLDGVFFDYAQYGLLGQAPSGASFSNVVKIANCTFNSNIAVGHIRNPAVNWHLDCCAFENLANGTGACITMDAACTALGTVLTGCYSSDASAGSAWTWIRWQGVGLVVRGGNMHGGGGSTAVRIIGPSSAVSISGNRFDNHATAVALGAGLVTGALVMGNDYLNTATEVSGTPVAPYCVEAASGGATAAFVSAGNMAVGASNGASVLFQVGGNNVVIAGLQNTHIVNALQRSTQTPAASGTVTPDPSQGDVFVWSAETGNALTGNLTINNPVNGAAGQEIEFDIQEDATGGRTITFGTNYKLSWAPVLTAGLRNTIRFRCTDGTKWVQVGAAGVGLPA